MEELFKPYFTLLRSTYLSLIHISSRMTRYASELASLFHKFYNACRVKCGEEDLMQARLALCLATKTVLSNLLGMLHISAPVTM